MDLGLTSGGVDLGWTFFAKGGGARLANLYKNIGVNKQGLREYNYSAYPQFVHFDKYETTGLLQ